jgi:hypothetical protein
VEAVRSELKDVMPVVGLPQTRSSDATGATGVLFRGTTTVVRRKLFSGMVLRPPKHDDYIHGRYFDGHQTMLVCANHAHVLGAR